ncbi:hypothetical protein TNIN_124631 [Trichonephila inaurata madagascariensis]|uniref:Uncharacterized protein n=1 Tax=Trichonephila inaurata madagascariensis TaxID=2747483 RepID=A0A8X6XPP5_9ARAC|nr:hypothetical protein TNIN_124631 [Trichonephila inaurata madagascariensis]
MNERSRENEWVEEAARKVYDGCPKSDACEEHFSIGGLHHARNEERKKKEGGREVKASRVKKKLQRQNRKCAGDFQLRHLHACCMREDITQN